MQDLPTPNSIPRSQLMAERAFGSLQRFLHIEAVGGAVLLVAAAIALIWANSSYAHFYHHLWHLPVTIGLGGFTFAKSLHFWINDALMTVFFLVVGMEIRRELHEGALSKLDQALLPLIAAVGGVLVPAAVYLMISPQHARGWAVPTATDIAFAVGVLAILGRSVPASVRIFLLALAIIDDVIAVLIIALFYSGGLNLIGFVVAGMGLLMMLAFQRIGVGSAIPYVLPGGIVWTGLLMTGAHPTLAGVVLGLMTPVRPMLMREHPLDAISRVSGDLRTGGAATKDVHDISATLRNLRKAGRELLPPVVRVQQALHPWVAYIIMPVFALANAGVTLPSGSASIGSANTITFAVALALVFGKPIGIIGASWIAVRLGWCSLPTSVTWGWVCLIGLLAGIGFTMSIFIAMLAFTDEGLLNAAKLGVLVGSAIAGLVGLAWGFLYARRMQQSL